MIHFVIIRVQDRPAVVIERSFRNEAPVLNLAIVVASSNLLQELNIEIFLCNFLNL